MCQSIQYFEASFDTFINDENTNNYYNFPMNRDTSYLNELINANDYYFLALVYDNNENNNDIFINAFMGIGTFSEEHKSLKIVTKYSSEENNTVESLRKLSNLDINRDFVDGEYVNIEDSEYLFSQIDFILSDPYIPEKFDREYKSIDSENNLRPLAQRNEYCRRQYNLREPQNGRGEFQRR